MLSLVLLEGRLCWRHWTGLRVSKSCHHIPPLQMYKVLL